MKTVFHSSLLRGVIPNHELSHGKVKRRLNVDDYEVGSYRCRVRSGEGVVVRRTPKFCGASSGSRNSIPHRSTTMKSACGKGA